MEIKLAMAACAQGGQVFSSVITKCAARTNMVYLKAFRGSTILASPAISL
jgi:hypothetical protein